MKNSLFKRAVAAAAAVPLALTQCLTASFAVDFSDTALIAANKAASDEAITLETLCYIAPDKTESDWNTTLANKLKTAETTSSTIDISGYIADVVANTGKFGSVLGEILTGVNADGITYELKNNLDIVLTLKTDKVINGLYGAKENSLKELAEGLADTYNVPALANIDFLSVSTDGVITITLGTSALDSTDGKTVEVKFNFNDGSKDYNAEEFLGYTQAKVDECKKVAYDYIDALPAGTLTAEDAAGAKKKVDDNLSNYQDLINKANNGIAKLYGITSDKTVSGTVADVIAAINEQISARGYKRQIPATATAIMANATVSKNFAQALETFEATTGVTVDIDADELGTFADSLENVEATFTTAGTASFKGDFKDAEYDDVVKYYASQGKIVKSSYKQITVDADYSAALQGTGSVEVHIYRIVETEDIETSSTSTTTDVTTTTTTTGDEETTTTTTATDADTTTETTTTTGEAPVVTTVVQNVYLDLESTYGFYLDIDEEFSKDQIENATVNVVYTKGYTDAEGTVVVDETWSETYDVKDDLGFGTAVPNNTYTKDNSTFKYAVPVVYTGAGIADKTGKIVLQPNSTVATSSGEDASVIVYIGVKGDANLDNMVDGVDASAVLVYNAELAGGKTAAEITLSASTLVAGPTSVYDNFAAFLADANHDASIINDWNVMKGERLLDGTDASAILVYNAETVETGVFGLETWKNIVAFIH